MTDAAGLPADDNLAGLKILVVEDDTMIGFFVEDMLNDLGCSVWLTSGVAEALAVLDRKEPDGAVLDINLGLEFAFPIAARLESRKIPFIFATGYGRGGLPVEWRSKPVIQKPFDAATLKTALLGALEYAGTNRQLS